MAQLTQQFPAGTQADHKMVRVCPYEIRSRNVTTRPRPLEHSAVALLFGLILCSSLINYCNTFHILRF